jgi:hypothetical protein
MRQNTEHAMKDTLEYSTRYYYMLFVSTLHHKIHTKRLIAAKI